MPDPFHAEPILAEILKSLPTCYPVWETGGRLTLEGSSDASRREWRDEIFQPILHPLLMKARETAGQGRVRDMIALDVEFDKTLPSRLLARSRTAGRRVLTEFKSPAAERVLAKYSAEVLAGTAPGHLAVVMAARGAAFHLPPNLIAATYVLAELQGANSTQTLAVLWNGVGECFENLPPGELAAA